jgi:hypothetical protein
VYVTRSNTPLATGIEAIPAAIASGGMAAAAVAGIIAQNIPLLIGGGPRFDTNRPSLGSPSSGLTREKKRLTFYRRHCLILTFLSNFSVSSTSVSLVAVCFRALFSIHLTINNAIYCIVFVSFELTRFLHALKI